MDLDQLALSGYVARPGDPSYDVDRKIWNASCDRNPAMIIRCAGVSDVIAAVRSGRASDLPSPYGAEDTPSPVSPRPRAAW